LENKINNFDEDAFDLYSKLVESKAQHDDDAAELGELMEYMRKKKARADRIDDERRKHFEITNEKITRQRIQRDAARLLQQLYKAWWLKNKKTTGKGGDKKKKKK